MNSARYLLGFAAVGVTTALPPPIPPFTYSVIDANPNTGSSCCLDVCAVGDITGNGNDDVVIGAENATASGLVYYSYPDWKKVPIAQGQFTTDGRTGDVDGDGNVDVITCDNGVKSIYWYENPRGSTSTTWGAHKVGAGYAHDVEVGDLNNDKKLDIVTCSKKEVVVWIQGATPTSFTKRVILTSSGEGIGLADMDRDGDLDILFGASWIENPPDILKDTMTRYVVGSFGADTRTRAGDMDGDGDQDIVVSTSEGKGPVRWYAAPANPKTTTDWVAHTIESSLQRAHSLQLADFDMDGRLDVTTGQMHSSTRKRILVYLQQTKGKFTRLTLANSGTHNLQVGDIDGDGDSDIIGKNYAGTRVVELWTNQARR